MTEFQERIQKAYCRFQQNHMLGQTVADTVMHRLELKFVEKSPEPPLISKLHHESKTVTIYLDTNERFFLERSLDYRAVTNAVLDGHAARVLLRELYWFHQGTPEHETTLAHFSSPESLQAFVAGYRRSSPQK